MSTDGFSSKVHRANARNPHPRRGFGLLVVLEVSLIILSAIATLTFGIVHKFPYRFEVVPRGAYVPASSPFTLAVQGKPPTSSTARPLAPSKEVRVIVLRPDRINLLAGGEEQRAITLPKPLTTLAEVAKAVNDASWIESDSPGSITVKVALIVEKDASITIKAPETTRVLLQGPPGVFLCAHLGTLTFDGVRVESSQPPNASATPFRPFVLASGGTMHAYRSTFVGLGWDWNGSYGVSWSEGSTGEVIGSTFERNFIGLYTARARNMIIRDSAFRDSDLYGLDPHTYSTNLLIENVLAEGNKAHGIIFSDNVSGSVISRSVTRNNGENGIMMDKSSGTNLIENNQTYRNHGDGIVVTDSDSNTIRNNMVQDNRVGIRVSPQNASTTRIDNNTLHGNTKTHEGFKLTANNPTASNGGQWNKPHLARIAVVFGSAMLLTAIVFSAVRSVRLRRERKALP